MIHWLQPPKISDVAKYIECYWLIEKSDDSGSYRFPKLNPDPSAHLIISPTDQRYHYDLNPGVAAGKGSYWLHPHHQTFQLDHTDAFVHLGIKFHVGALYSVGPFAGLPTALDKVEGVEFDRLFNGVSISGAELVHLARTDMELCCRQLDAMLLPWCSNVKEDQHSQLTRNALQLIDSNTISELGALLHSSQRRLERSFTRVTGLTLKQCQSMNKLEAMLEYLHKLDSSEIDWVDVAFRFGFSDQPHLIRYLKKQIGLTPKTYVKVRGLTIDAYGGVSSA